MKKIIVVLATILANFIVEAQVKTPQSSQNLLFFKPLD